MANYWKTFPLRLAEGEWNMLKEYCKKNQIKITDLIRSILRLYFANPDLMNGIIKVANAHIETEQIVNSVTELIQKFEVLEKKLTSHPNESEFAYSLVKARIAEAILNTKQKARKKPITVDILREQIKKIDPSLAPFLVASASNGISSLDEVLVELEQKGELSRDYRGIIKFHGD
jgi:hypothetical protein